MTIKMLRLTGGILYFIGGLILVPVGAIFVASANTLLLAGPIVLLIPVIGAIFVVAGKWMTRKASFLEKGASSEPIMHTRNKHHTEPASLPSSRDNTTEGIAGAENDSKDATDLTEKRLAHVKGRFETARAIFFDVSDTLYVNKGLENEYPRVLTQSVADVRGISYDEAEALIKETTAKLQQTEKHVTKIRAVRELGVTREQAQEYIALIKPHDFLTEDPRLRKLITELEHKYTLGIISNLRRTRLHDVLDALGLREEDFSYLVTEDLVELTKPHPEPFLKAIELSGLPVDECVFVGDSPTKDMQPAKELGMLTILVKREPDKVDMLNADAFVGGIEELKVLVDKSA